MISIKRFEDFRVHTDIMKLLSDPFQDDPTPNDWHSEFCWLLLVPAISATAERSFSALLRLKTIESYYEPAETEQLADTAVKSVRKRATGSWPQ